MKKKLNNKLKLQNIAFKELGLHTLKARNSDSLDFYTFSVWSIEKALDVAYKAGYSAGRISKGQEIKHKKRKLEKNLIEYQI